MKRTILVCAVICVVAAAVGRTAYAQFMRTEWVYVLAVPSSVLDDRVFVLREHAESWLFQLGAGCDSLWRYNGKWVTVEHPGIFGGLGNTLRLADARQSCRVVQATQFDLAPAFFGPLSRTLQPQR